MKVILDQEMPVGRRSRRFLVFWWTTAAMVMIGAIGIFLMKQNQILPALIPIEQPAAPTQGQKQNPTATSTNAMASADQDQPASMTSPSGDLPIHANSNSSHQTTDVQKSNYSTNASSSEKLIESLTANETDDQKTGISSSTIPTSSESIEVTVDPTINEWRNESIASPIPSILATSLILEETSSSSLHSIEPSKAKRSVPLFEPDLSISGLIGQNGGAGAYGGAGLSVNLDRKLSITTGLGYSVFHPDATFFGTRKADLAAAPESNAILIHDSFYTGINTYIEASNVNKEAGYNEIEPLVETVTQWQVGAGVKWKFNRRFFTEAGVLIGFSTQATSEYPIIEGDPLTGIVEARIGNSFNSYDVIRSTMTSLYAGAGYRFGQHLDAFVQWKHGLDTYLLNDNVSGLSTDQYSGERSDYIRGLNLGLRYTL